VSLTGRHISLPESVTGDLGAGAFELSLGTLLTSHTVLGGLLNVSMQFGDQLGQFSLAIGPSLGAVARLTETTSLMPRFALQYAVVAIEPRPAWSYQAMHGLSIGGGLPFIVELASNVGLSLGPGIGATFFPDESTRIIEYGFYVGLLVWSAAEIHGDTTDSASLYRPETVNRTAHPRMAPSPVVAVAHHLSPPPVAKAPLMQVCDGDDLLVVAANQSEPARVSCKRVYSTCVGETQAGQPGCREYHCNEAAAHIYDVCKMPSKQNGNPMTRSYFYAMCEQKNVNKSWSQCQINCLANAACDAGSLSRCFTGEDCDDDEE
jgi:hypothetical protein